MKKKLYILFVLPLLAFASPANAGEAMSIEETEERMMNACLDDKTNSPEQCTCVLDGFKRELPKEHYQIYMEFLSIAMNGDGRDIVNFMLSGKLSLEKMEEMGKTMEKAGKKIEAECEGVNLNFDTEET